MRCPERLRRDAGVVEVIEIPIPVSDGERRKGALGPRSRPGDDRRRVETAGKERSDRHVRDEVRGHGLVQPGAQLFDVVPNLPALEPPERSHGDAPRTGVVRQPVRRRELPDSLEGRAVEGDVAVREKIRKRVRVEASGDSRNPEKRLRLGGERESPGQESVVERLDPDPVAREQESPVHLVPQRQGEHSLDTPEGLRPFPAEQPVRDFPVALRDENFSAGLEFPPERAEVVDLAVVDERGLSVRRDRWLLAAKGRIQDREPPVSQDDPPVRARPGSAPVRSPPVQSGESALQDRRIDPRRINPTGDPAHRSAGRRGTGNEKRETTSMSGSFRGLPVFRIPFSVSRVRRGRDT